MKRWPSEASVKFLVKLFSKSLRLVRRSLTPLPLWRAAHEEKLGKQGLCPAFPGRWGSCPLSHGCRRASSPKGGAKSRLPLWGRCHAFGMTERARRWLAPQLSGSRLLGAPPKACAKPSLASPFGGGAPVGGGEGSGKPPSWCVTVREKRFAVSLAFFCALRAYKGKVVGLCPTTRKLFEKSLTKNF